MLIALPWGGLPRWNTDGSSNSYDRARSTAPDWAYNDKEINKVFMTLKQRFADTWQATLNATHSEVEFDSKMMYVDAYVNKADGMLVGPYSNYGPALIMSAAPVGTVANVKLMRWICSLTVFMNCLVVSTI